MPIWILTALSPQVLMPSEQPPRLVSIFPKSDLLTEWVNDLVNVSLLQCGRLFAIVTIS